MLKQSVHLSFPYKYNVCLSLSHARSLTHSLTHSLSLSLSQPSILLSSSLSVTLSISLSLSLSQPSLLLSSSQILSTVGNESLRTNHALSNTIRGIVRSPAVNKLRMRQRIKCKQKPNSYDFNSVGTKLSPSRMQDSGVKVL